jgi:hypothetical protein
MHTNYLLVWGQFVVRYVECTSTRVVGTTSQLPGKYLANVPLCKVLLDRAGVTASASFCRPSIPLHMHFTPLHRWPQTGFKGGGGGRWVTEPIWKLSGSERSYTFDGNRTTIYYVLLLLLTYICLRDTSLSYDVAHRTVRSWRQNSFGCFSRWPWNTLHNRMCGVACCRKEWGKRYTMRRRERGLWGG